MTRKDYQRLAKAFAKALKQAATDEQRHGVRLAYRAMVAELHDENHAFREDLFAAAAGMGEGK